MPAGHYAADSQDGILSPDPLSTVTVYKVYKRRFWGLAQLVLLNIVVSWDVSALFEQQTQSQNLANVYMILRNSVAHLFFYIHHRIAAFWCLRIRHQLDEHWLSLCLLRSQSSRHPHS
jgi:hypothetical protein